MQSLPGLLLVLSLASTLYAQTPLPQSSTTKPDDYSGMYTFLQEGEFLQLTVEDEGKVTGFVSRYSDSQAEHRTFVHQFLKSGKLNGKEISFSTETVQNVSYDFKGTIERGEAAKPEDEAYYILRGTLTQTTTDANRKTTSQAQAVVLKSFPQDLDDGK